MKLITCALVCLALGTTGGFALGYVLLAKPAVTALEAQRTETRDREADLANYKAAVEKRDGELREALQHFSGRTTEAAFLNPEGVGAAFGWFASELARPIQPAPQEK